MEKQRVARQAALVKQLECGCPDSTCADGKSCSHPTRRQTHRPGPANSRPPSRQDNNQVSSTTGSGSIHTNGQPPRVYSREIRGQQIVQKSTNSANTPPLVSYSSTKSKFFFTIYSFSQLIKKFHFLFYINQFVRSVFVVGMYSGTFRSE